jgi:hypothetical protein
MSLPTLVVLFLLLILAIRMVTAALTPNTTTDTDRTTQ